MLLDFAEGEGTYVEWWCRNRFGGGCRSQSKIFVLMPSWFYLKLVLHGWLRHFRNEKSKVDNHGEI